MLIGDEQGIAIYNKIGNSQEFLDRQYFQNLFEAAGKYKSAFFSDITEQRKKKLNNQNIYWLRMIDNKWRVDLFHKPNNEIC